MRAEPVAEHDVPDHFRAVEPEHMEVRPGILEAKTAVLVPGGFPDRELPSVGLKRLDVGLFITGVGDSQVNVDHVLGRKAGHRSQSNVLKSEHAIAKGRSDAAGEPRVSITPGPQPPSSGRPRPPRSNSFVRTASSSGEYGGRPER